MASPQLEDGYFRVANELAEAFARYRLPGQEAQIVWAIARLTYGYQKPAEAISYGRLHKLTGIPRIKTAALVKSLSLKKVIAVSHMGDRQPLTMQINKDYDQWRPVPQKGDIPHNGDRSVSHNGDSSVSHMGDTLKKERNRKKTLVSPKGDLRESEFEIFWSRYPPRGVPARRSGKAKAFKAWVSLGRKRELPQINAILACLNESRGSSQWKDPLFIPLASSWLNSLPWRDGEDQEAPTTGSSLLDSYYAEGERHAR